MTFRVATGAPWNVVTPLGKPPGIGVENPGMPWAARRDPGEALRLAGDHPHRRIQGPGPGLERALLGGDSALDGDAGSGRSGQRRRLAGDDGDRDRGIGVARHETGDRWGDTSG